MVAEAGCASSLAWLCAIFAIYMLLRYRHGLQAFFLDQSSTDYAYTIYSSVNAFESFFEPLDIIAGALRVQESLFALDRICPLLCRVKRIVLIVGFELAGCIEDILTEDFKFFFGFLHLL